MHQYEDYSNTPMAPSSSAAKPPPPLSPSSSSPPPEEVVTGAPSGAPVVDTINLPVIDLAQGLQAEPKVIHSEERIEYRDQDGNLLDEEQVKALEGKVEFQTRYETRTRVLDANGNEIIMPSEGVAGPLVNAVEPGTVKVKEEEVKRDEVETKEETKEAGKASPASEGVVAESAPAKEETPLLAEEEVVSEEVVAESVPAETYTETKWEEAVHTETVVVDQDGNTIAEE